MQRFADTTVEQLKQAGVLNSYDEIGTYMWHGGAHHIGYDVQ